MFDVRLPPNNGHSPKRRLRQLRPEKRPATKRKAIENGATGLLTKPIDFTLLREEIDTRLERTSRTDPPSHL
jgi:DNA-binding response OmpR family regulator